MKYLLLLSVLLPVLATEKVVDIRQKMGSRFEITVLGADGAAGQAAIDAAYAEIDRLEATISSWQADSQTSEVNRAAGKSAVPVSAELFNLVRRSLKVSRLTDGAFDITFAGAGKLWDFRTQTIPTGSDIRIETSNTAWHRLVQKPILRLIRISGRQ